MSASYSDAQKLADAKRIARNGRCFVVQIPVKRPDGTQVTKFLLYREAEPKNQLVGKRMTVGSLLKLVKDATKTVDTPN